jgi:hypothetical protein
MNTTWKDLASTAFIIAAGVVVFAKLQEYTWWLIGSWKGALAVLAALGVGMLVVNIQQLLEFETLANAGEIILWAATITMFIASLVVATTTKAEFLVSAGLLAIIWLGQVLQDAWDRVPTHHGTHYAPHH